MVPQFGLCIVSDLYFEDFPNVRHMDNKHENRPYFLAIREDSGVTWLLPLSSQVSKYRAKIQQDEKRHGSSLFHYITNVAGQERVVLIGNCIPVTDQYIVRPFTIRGTPYVFGSKDVCKQILSKFRRYIAMVRAGKLTPAVNILEIESVLLASIGN